MLARKYKNRYSVIDESSGQFVVLQQPRPEAVAILKSRMTYEQATELLDTEVPASRWHAAHASAAAATAAAVEQALQGVAETADVQEIRERQSELAGAVAELRSEVDADRLQQERRDLEAWLSSEFERHKQGFISKGKKVGLVEMRVIYQHLWSEPNGQRLQELRAA